MNEHLAPDPHLPMLTFPQAERLRNLTADHFLSRRGIRPRIEGDAVLWGDGHRSPLLNLAHQCRTVAEEHWPRLVEEHFTRLDNASQGGENAQELLAGVVLRLLPDDALAGELANGFRYVRPVAEGLALALALDTPTSVRMLNDHDVARAGLERLWAAGRENLIREPVEHVEVTGPQGARLQSVHGDSHFVASKALVLPELARATTGRELPEAGALVVVPSRNLLAFHPIEDGTVVDAVNDLGGYALGAHEDGPGALSPRLYWWHQGRLTSLTVIDHETRSFSVVPPPELMEVMRKLHAESASTHPEPEAPTHPEPEAGPQPQPEPDSVAAAEDIVRLAQGPAGLAHAFTVTKKQSDARFAADPACANLETWEAWVWAMQTGSALFRAAASHQGTVECRIADRVLPLPATGPVPVADARAWLDAFYLGVVCREQDRLTLLCDVPPDDLRRAAPHDAYVFHWIETLRAVWLRQPMDDVVQHLIATMETSHPHVATRTPSDFLNLIDYQPAALLHRMVAGDREAFTETLTEALAHHERYWTDRAARSDDAAGAGGAAPYSRVALGPLAMACLAYDWDFPVDVKSPYLPVHLLRRDWLGEFPT
ncbi:Imm49 family immunity protein [Streptomyces sp. NPDC093510]|uniref:Imm49 family immunity protein n=1 Tax=Streptomyces sp. NPDC093510 TaxID=3155199 RepID=UPI00341D656F